MGRRARWLAMGLVAVGTVSSAAGCGAGGSTIESRTTSITGPSGPSAATSLEATSDSVMYAVSPLTAVLKVPEVVVRDQYGKPMSGVRVTFESQSAGGSVGTGLVTTDSAGKASCGRWTVGSEEGVSHLAAAAVGTNVLTFSAVVVRPSNSGITDVGYILQLRDGKSLPPNTLGYIVLSSDGTFRLIYGYSYGTINFGTYTQSGSTFTFQAPGFGDQPGTGTIEGDRLTLSYDDYLDQGFHAIVVEVFVRFS